jgi:protein phosphatase
VSRGTTETAASPAAGAERTGLVVSGGLRAAARTDRGTVRKDNQDAFVCLPERGLFAVIDGMGGEQGGQRAATLAREALLAEKDPVKALAAANQAIHRAAEGDADLRGMGCVASALRVLNGTAHIAHVGDTRIFLAGATGCEQLTRDHTVAASRQEDLGISHRGAREIPGHNQVTRDIGGRPQTDDQWIDRLEAPLEEGTLVLLCSDGLYGVVPAEELFSRLRDARKSGASPQVLVDELIDLALARGTRDNVTAIVVRREGPPAPRPEPTPEAPAVKTTAAPVEPAAVKAPAATKRRRGGLGGLLLLLVGAGLGWAAHSLITPPPAPAPTPEPPAPMEMTTDVPAVTDRLMRGAALAIPQGAGRWTIHVGAGSRLVIRDAAIDAPGLATTVTLDSAESRLELVDSRLTLASFTAEGPAGARVAVRGGRLDVRDGGPRVTGATLEGVDQAPPSPAAAEVR